MLKIKIQKIMKTLNSENYENSNSEIMKIENKK